MDYGNSRGVSGRAVSSNCNGSEQRSGNSTEGADYCPACAIAGCSADSCACAELAADRVAGELRDTLEDCPSCDGTGGDPGRPCEKCGGAGQVYSGDKLAELVGVIPDAPPAAVALAEERAARAREERRAFAALMRAGKGAA